MVKMVRKPSGNWVGCRDRVISGGIREGWDTQTDCKDFVAEGNLDRAHMALCSILEVGPLSEGPMADHAPPRPSGSSCGGWQLVSGAGEQPECSGGNQGTDCAAWQLSLFVLWGDHEAHKNDLHFYHLFAFTVCFYCIWSLTLSTAHTCLLVSEHFQGNCCIVEQISFALDI